MEHLVAVHHDDQKRIARNAISALYPIWELIDFHDLRKSTPTWLKAARPIVEQAFLRSQYVAAEFVRNYRRAELPDAEPLDIEYPDPLAPTASPPTTDRKTSLQIMVSLRVTGPVWVANQSQPGMSTEMIPQLMRDGFSKSSGAATRLILNGGRGVVRTLVGSDRLARGVAGIADRDACRSCRFLTQPILKSAGSKKLDAVAVGHDFCTCSAKPIY